MESYIKHLGKLPLIWNSNGIDSDSEVVVLADGDCVVVLDVRKIKLTKWQNSEATREFILKVLCPCGSIGFVHATSAGLIYWKETGKHEQ